MQLQTLGELGESRVVGPPGTGKTSFLARQIEHDARSHGSEAVVALSHTNAAAREIADRNVPLPEENIGTLHSFAYRALSSPLLLQVEPYLSQFSEQRPEFRLSGRSEINELEVRSTQLELRGDKLMQEYHRMRNLRRPRELWPYQAQVFAHAWEAFKKEEDGIDFTDMIELCLSDVDELPGYREVLIADEAQDLSGLQLALLWKWARPIDKVVMALDPDQSIYGFSGADPRVFLHNRPDRQRVLQQSYRLPRRVYEYAMAWIEQNKDREPITFRPRDAEGDVQMLSRVTWKGPELLISTVEDELANERTVMLLASCAYMLQPLIFLLRSEGIPFWNSYRFDNGAWNPLGRRGKGSTVSRILAYLRPWTDPSERTPLWTGGELIAWLELTKGVVERGMKQRMEFEVTESLPVGVETMVKIMGEDNLGKAMQGPPDGLTWLGQNLLKARRSVGEYVAHLVSKQGADVLQESPRVTVGTIHCSPPDELVLTASGEQVSMEDLDPRIHRLVGYSRKSRTLSMSSGHGRRKPYATGAPFSKSISDFSGDLVVMETVHSCCRVTPEHRVVVRYADEFYEKWLVYLMRRDDWWRVGICVTAHRPYRSGGVLGRLATEQADAGWILSIHETREAALEAEALIQGQFGIPGLTFEAARNRSLNSDDLHRIHNATSAAVSARAQAMLDQLGFLEEYPLYIRIPGGKARGMASYWFETAAVNLIGGMMEVPICWVPPVHADSSPGFALVQVHREKYTGPIFGLQVHPHEHYVSGGQVVHNSVKGGEADAVILFPDLSQQGLVSYRRTGTEAVRRAFYVGMTRAKERLFLCQPAQSGSDPMAIQWPPI